MLEEPLNVAPDNLYTNRRTLHPFRVDVGEAVNIQVPCVVNVAIRAWLADTKVLVPEYELSPILVINPLALIVDAPVIAPPAAIPAPVINPLALIVDAPVIAPLVKVTNPRL
jgi:hypothetical protein